MSKLWSVLALLVSFVAQGSTELIGSEIVLHGRIVKPPCTINDGQPVEIDFGNVGVDKVNGNNYAKSFTLHYVCEGVSLDKVLKYLGTATTFDNAAVQSNIAGFGIQLRHLDNGVAQPFKVGGTLEIPANHGSSQFIATPVKKAGATLAEGVFAAAATLQLEYP